MKYTLQQTDDKLQLLDEQLQELPLSTLLQQHPAARVFAFDAPMGAGKTTFIKQLCEEMDVTDVVNSPTFAIVNEYTTTHQQTIYHFDCYRLKNVQEAIQIGTEDYLYSGNYCFIEWPDIIADLLPEDTIFVHIQPLDDHTRELTIENANF